MGPHHSRHSARGDQFNVSQYLTFISSLEERPNMVGICLDLLPESATLSICHHKTPGLSPRLHDFSEFSLPHIG